MDYGKTPHACFKFEHESIAAVGDDLCRVLAHDLRTRFWSVRVKKRRLFVAWVIDLQVEKMPFTILLKQSKYENYEWVLLAAPSVTPPLRKLLRGSKPVDYSPELVQVCREVHTSLKRISEVTAIRWYFEGFHTQTPAVSTPDELPWTRS